MKSASLLFLVILSACGASVEPSYEVTPVSTSTEYSYPGAGEPAARFIFHKDYFVDIEDFLTFQNTQFKCLGDVLHTFKVTGGDYSAGAQYFNVADYADAFAPTYHPDFVRNLSVDMTRTYYPETLPYTLQSDPCSYRGEALNHPNVHDYDPSPCADFDPTQISVQPAPAPTASPTPVVSPTPVPVATPAAPDYVPYLGFYRVRDPWCSGQGTIRSADPETTKSFIGGVNIDLNRDRLGVKEDLLMLITYQAFEPGDSWPYTAVSPSQMQSSDHTQLQVNLIGTGLGLESLLSGSQPRPWRDYGEMMTQVYWKKLATLNDPYSSMRTEQVIIPLSENAMVDRIRIERVRGTFHLYQIDLYRLGNRGE